MCFVFEIRFFRVYLGPEAPDEDNPSLHQQLVLNLEFYSGPVAVPRLKKTVCSTIYSELMGE